MKKMSYKRDGNSDEMITNTVSLNIVWSLQLVQIQLQRGAYLAYLGVLENSKPLKS
jgi:hypothetical protein